MTSCAANFSLIVLLGATLVSACPADSLHASPDSMKSAALISGIRSSSIGEECLAQIFEVLDRSHGARAGEAALRLLEAWSKENQFSTALLYRCTEAEIARNDPRLSRGILAIWENINGPVRANITKLEVSGGLAREDSLFTVLDRSVTLSAADLLQWAHIREVVSGYAATALLYSRVLSADPGRSDLVYLKLLQWLENAPADSVALALGVFQKGALHCRSVDTIGIQYRLADFYSRHDLFDAEAEVLAAVPETRSRLAPRLLDLAARALSRRMYATAIPPAIAVWNSADKNQAKPAAADIVYRAYMGLNLLDSALIWLERTGEGVAGFSTESRRIDAVTLNQATGRLAQAAVMIRGLPPAFARDTLALRQRLFEGDIAGAAEAVKKGVAWEQQPDETILWSARTLLFRGDIERLGPLLDSTLPDPAWSGAQEILRDRLMLSELRDSKDALAEWSRIEYNLFIGRPELAVAKLSEGDAKIPLLLRIIKDQLGRGRIGMAEELFRKEGDTLDSPEYIYLRAENLLRLDARENSERADALLRRLIRDYPEEVFAERARVLLAGRSSGK